MVWSAFRASDDQQKYSYNIPDNMWVCMGVNGCEWVEWGMDRENCRSWAPYTICPRMGACTSFVSLN